MAQVVLAGATLVAVVAVVTSIPTLLRVPADNDARAHLTGALVVLTGGAAITFAAYLGHHLRCGHHCDRGGDALTGLASLHRWWHRHDAWQWSTQLTIAALGLALAAFAFALAARRSPRARAPFWLAWVVYVAWAGLVFAAPAVYDALRS